MRCAALPPRRRQPRCRAGSAKRTNIILDNWKFSTFIDVGLAGVGDRHIDIYWALWSLEHNLQTDKYTDYFLSLYGEDNYDKDILKKVAEIESQA